MGELKFNCSLHNHTDYSNIRLRDSTNKLSTLIPYANELGHTAVAITEHDFTGGWVKAKEEERKIRSSNPNFKVILGNEVYLCRNGLNADNFNPQSDKYYHFVLLAKNAKGAKQIQEISTRAWLRSYMAKGMRRVPTYYQDLVDIIGADKGNVIGLTGCLGGVIGTQLLKKDESLSPKIEQWLHKIKGIFGEGNFFLEMQPSTHKDQVYVNGKIVELSSVTGIPYVITCDSHYLRKEDRKVHEAFLNSQSGDREVGEFYTFTYLMNTEQVQENSGLDNKILEKAFANIDSIVAQCEDYSLEKPLHIPILSWKEHDRNPEKLAKYVQLIPELSKFADSPLASEKELAWAIIEGVESKSDLQNEEAYAEINDNLSITWQSSRVNNAEWAAYFLNLQKIIDLCWKADSLVGPSRGSAGGFLLMYVLDIIQINPLRETTKMYSWRFLNPERVSVLDVDVDIEGSKRSNVLNTFRNVYGSDRVANVATFGTEQSKSAILTAVRGLGLSVELGQYISSLIPSDRGKVRTLRECYYGDKEKGFSPIGQFVTEMNNYPDVWEVASNIEGLINRLGSHAGGVIFVDEPFTESTALARTPDGTIVTQYELHDSEKCSLIKYDILSVEALDKIHNCIDLLCEYGYVERKSTLRETYESVVGVYNLEREAPDMWKMIWNHNIHSLFQMEKPSGVQGIALIRPKSVDELAVLNSTIRLMSQEKGEESPLQKWANHRKDLRIWFAEMEKYGLSEEERQFLITHPAITDGICESQEGLMSLLFEEKLGGFSLNFADSVRKGIAKKQGDLFDKCEKEFYQVVEEKGLSRKLADYVWQVLFRAQRGYSFNRL